MSPHCSKRSRGGRKKQQQIPKRLEWIATGIEKSIPVVVSNEALHGLVLCHQRLVQTLAYEVHQVMEQQQEGVESKDSIRYVKELHIKKALAAMGISDGILEKAKHQLVEEETAMTEGIDFSTTTATKPPKKKQTKQRHRHRQWSAEELAEQERLLSQSKAKAEVQSK